MGRDMSYLFGDLDNSEYLAEPASARQYTNFETEDVGGNSAGDIFETSISTVEDEALFDSLQLSLQFSEARHDSRVYMPGIGMMSLYVDAAGNTVDSRRSVLADIEQDAPAFAVSDADLTSTVPLPYDNGNGLNWRIQQDGHSRLPDTAAQHDPIDSNQLSSQHIAYQGYSSGSESQGTRYNFTQPSPFTPLNNLPSTSNGQLDNRTP